jgi:hypothetical protein
LRRSSETPQQTEARLADKRNREDSRRSSETPQQTEARLADKRARDITRRAQRLPMDLKNAAFSYKPQLDYNMHPSVQIGNMEVVCTHCGALKWKGETPGLCCASGKVKLPPLPPPPEPLKSLISGTNPHSKHFLENIRKYNSCFQMTSFGATKEIREPGFMPTFKVQGQIYHSIGSLLPQPSEEHQFLQIYFMGDSAREAQRRCSVMPDT